MFTKLTILALLVSCTASVPIVLSEGVEKTVPVVDENAEFRFPCRKPSPECFDVPESIVQNVPIHHEPTTEIHPCTGPKVPPVVANCDRYKGRTTKINEVITKSSCQGPLNPAVMARCKDLGYDVVSEGQKKGVKFIRLG
ncbi:hypothetical protein L596_017634 [Steinernema carpocapsae]|uniref:Uncharacterized protein n=1 Tax=Steinernema carpocapsae TaxID=34508 RepID=A0A4U5N285_STECR|nr:hypothetical protein L596_017634 [Steinernema carpocapsae]